MGKTIKAIRGMPDILPDSIPYWSHLESALRAVAHASNYREIRTPAMESTALFIRSIGDETDIVSKEMYTFDDRNGESMTLRPEGTASCVRAGNQHGLFYNQIQRLWYMGPMFRYERPQKGRYRQFHQFGLEAYGLDGPEIEAEMLSLCHQLWEHLGLDSDIRLQINHLGSASVREQFKLAFVDYLKPHADQLDSDSQRRLDTNPLRIFDSKVPETQALLAGAPSLLDYLSDSDREHLNRLTQYLDALSISYEINSSLVRGLDYYDGVVFEWVTDQLGAQGTVCAGGRYDGLVEQLGGRSTPAFGLAAGLERLVLLLKEKSQMSANPDVIILVSDESLVSHAFSLVKTLRKSLMGQSIAMDWSGGKMKALFKRADKSGAAYALVVGETEVSTGRYGLKSLRERSEQQSLCLEECIEALQKGVKTCHT